jgi:hypothetical protein
LLPSQKVYPKENIQQCVCVASIEVMVQHAKVISICLLLFSAVCQVFSLPNRIPRISSGDDSIIEWSPEVKLKWSDFRGDKKPGRDFAVASSTCGFGYDGIMAGNVTRINVFVRFYRYESWHDKNYDLPDVLAHEQLHFDICELFGRLLYREVTRLRSEGKLTENNLEEVYNRLIREYGEFQDRYDKETDHSTIASKQREWNSKIRRELERLQPYADYVEFD